ncbi:GH92 family glycosyl hydrolase [Galbibacter sp.]|uniref:GH92 family glycosyl hydrolase n=1 Tax=Galbibacter sp. TaxID=2918471 RepID=UPI003A8DB7BB
MKLAFTAFTSTTVVNYLSKICGTIGLFSVLLGQFSCQEQPKSVTQTPETNVSYTEYVNPFIGTAPLTDPEQIGYTPPKDWRVWAGLVYPGSSLPNAMVQLSPITAYSTGAGYQYEDTEILGFTHTNKGHWNFCNIPILPISGEKASYPYKSSFKHSNEKASAAYYQVYLEDYKVNVELSSTLRAGIHKYTFEAQDKPKILFDLGTANNHVDRWELEKIGDSAVAGFQQMGRERIYFYANLNTPITSLQKNNEGKSKGYTLLNIGESTTTVVLRIGLSFVSIENAKENLAKEIGTRTLEEVRESGESVWNDLLSKIAVKGGSKKEKTLFYTSLYRTFLWPALRSDSNGDFRNEKDSIVNKGHRYYTNPSFWDTYRNKLVLLEILDPELCNDIIKSLVDRGSHSGFIPTFFHGDHAAPFISGSYLRGIKDFDVDKAYQLLLNNAYKEGGTRPFIEEYISEGFIADPDIENPHVETKGKAGVSKTLEYAYDDYALALLAKELKDTTHYQDLMKRSKNYKNVFDTKTNFMRGKLEDGSWITPFNPQYPYYEYMYREANAWQLSFYVPHDMEGLKSLYGSDQSFEAKLDSLFSLKWNPDHIARNVSSFIGQYCHGNQPDHEAPFAYYFVDKPEKSQKIIDTILSDFYGIGTEGLALSGMDDAGEMSSWYVCSAMGLYPFSPADTEYLVSVPIFDQIIVHKGQEQELKISNDMKSRSLKGILVNDAPIDGYFIPHSLFVEGGSISIETK